MKKKIIGYREGFIFLVYHLVDWVVTVIFSVMYIRTQKGCECLSKSYRSTDISSQYNLYYSLLKYKVNVSILSLSLIAIGTECFPNSIVYII